MDVFLQPHWNSATMAQGSLGRASTAPKKHHKTSPFPSTPYHHSQAVEPARPAHSSHQHQDKPSETSPVQSQLPTTSFPDHRASPRRTRQRPTHNSPRPDLSRTSSLASLTAPTSPTYPASVLSEDSAQHPFARGSITSTRGKGRTTTSNRAPGIMEETEEQDELRGLRSDGQLGLAGLDRYNRSAVSVGSRQKADKMLGLESNAKLASLYLVSGLGKATGEWSLADMDATRGVQPLEDSLGLFWRPEMLGSCFSGEKGGPPSAPPVDERGARKDSDKSTFSNGGLSKNLQGKQVPDAGPDGAQKLVAKTLKSAHPRDVEVVNSVLAPPTTCHAFSFIIPKHDALAEFARERLASSMSSNPYTSATDMNRPGHPDGAANTMVSATELTFYGVTLTVWTHADKERALQLKGIKSRSDKIKLGTQNSLSSMNPISPDYRSPDQRKVSTTREGKRSRRSLRRMLRNRSDADLTMGSETETGVSDSDPEGPLGRRGRGWTDRFGAVESVPEDVKAVFDEQSDVYWMPYAITMVSRFPIYDTLQDYLRLSWARFSKNARVHMTQVSRILNTIPPRPGGTIHLPVGISPDDEVVLETCMPGGLMDFDKGLVKVDFQIWPLFQALDLNHIITCAEVALSHSGRIIFCSKHPAMLHIAVSSLKYLVELRGWTGICVPIIHARDATFLIEDPGPYIIGMSTECRYLLAPPGEVVVVDIDSNSLSCRSPPPSVISPRPRREKAKHRLLATLGPSYPTDRSIPMEFKVSYPKGTFRPINKMTWTKGDRPAFLGERLRAPGWWKFESVISLFDKFLADKQKKPTLIQRLTRSGVNRAQAQLTVGEQLAKSMMRRRALHYVEARDDLENKVAKINKRLLRLIQEGEHWKSQFEMFEKYADKLTMEANELKTKIERERREAKRLSSLANEQTKANLELEEKLKATEDARAEAMRQLSDMHHSIQELEREREDIMNSIEMQIVGALDSYLPPPSPAFSSRAGTPTSSQLDDTAVDSARSQTVRPFAADSQRSTMSGMTGMSVLCHAKGERRRPGVREAVKARGDVKGGRGKEGSVVESLQSGAEGRGQMGVLEGSIAERVANIQAKLELALSVVSSQRAASSMTNRDTEMSEDDTDPDGQESAPEDSSFFECDDTLTESPSVLDVNRSRSGLSEVEAEGGSGDDTDTETERGGHSHPSSVIGREAIEKGEAPPLPMSAEHACVQDEKTETGVRPRRATSVSHPRSTRSTTPVNSKEPIPKSASAAAHARPQIAGKPKRINHSKTQTLTTAKGILLAHARSASGSDSGMSDVTASGPESGRGEVKKAREEEKRMSAMSITEITFGKAV